MHKECYFPCLSKWSEQATFPPPAWQPLFPDAQPSLTTKSGSGESSPLDAFSSQVKFFHGECKHPSAAEKGLTIKHLRERAGPAEGEPLPCRELLEFMVATIFYISRESGLTWVYLH